MSGRATASVRPASSTADTFVNNESSLELNKDDVESRENLAEEFLGFEDSYFGPKRSIRLDSNTTHIDLEESALRENCKVSFLTRQWNLHLPPMRA
jgi:hypothetical protein